MSGYDVIGDVHGCYEELVALLRKMGYRKKRGVWRHHERFAVFTGDLVDRGPEIEQVLRTVAAMVDAGVAECILGNHEADAIRDYFLAPHVRRTRSKRAQLAETHRQLGNELQPWIRWMQERPVVFESSGLRVVHGAWHESAAAFWRHHRLSSAEMLSRLADRRCREACWLRNLLFGPVMPFGGSFIRSRWYASVEELPQPTLWHAAFRKSKRIPHRRLTRSHIRALWGYPHDATPVITGHQSLPLHAALRPLRANVACVDYSAVFGGRLCAYRWDGERTLEASHFVSVPARKRLNHPRAR